MQGKPTGGKAQRTTSDPLFRIDQPAPNSLPGTITGGYLPLDRSSRDRGQQGLRLPPWIDVALFQQTTALQRAHDERATTTGTLSATFQDHEGWRPRRARGCSIDGIPIVWQDGLAGERNRAGRVVVLRPLRDGPQAGLAWGVVVQRALELGINYFDTAPLYGKGRSEEVLGEALRGVIEPYYLATKVGYYPEPFNYTRDDVWRGIDASLKRLKRDHLHLLQLHESEQAGWEGIFGKGRALEAMLEAKEQGIADEIGLTGSDLDLMARVLEETDVFVSVITFLKYDLLTQEARDKLIPTAVDREVAVICASPLHGGLLGSTRDRWVQRERFSELHPRLRQIESLLENEEEPIERIGLRYLLSDPRVSLVLSGVQDIAELEASCSVSDSRHLDAGLIEAIEGMTG